jgi:hypothetical protein
MTDTIDLSKPKTPGIVIFAAILNFISTAIFFAGSFVCALVIIFGNAFGVREAVTKQIQAAQTAGAGDATYAVMIVFAVILVVLLIFGLFYLFLGLGLLKGQKWAWYVQIGLSILGLLGFPLGTVIGAVILFFFFQHSIREYFKV